MTDADFIGLFPVEALASALFPAARLTERSIEVEFGQTVLQEELVGYLCEAGYEPAPLVREQGEFAKRGAIIDLFPPSSARPVRIELLGDQVYSLRFFDPVSQRSQGEVERVVVTPARVSVDSGVTILDYLAGDAVVVHRGIDDLCRQVEGAGLADAARERLSSLLNVDVSGVKGDEDGLVLETASNRDLREIFESRRSELFKTLGEKMRGDWASCPFVYLFASNRHQAERLQEILRSYGVALPIVSDLSVDGKEKEWAIVVGPLRRGFRTASMILLTEEDIVGPKKRTVKHKWEGVDEFLNSFKDLPSGSTSSTSRTG